MAGVCLGLGSCAAILAWKGEATRPASMVWLAGLSFVLALGMLGLGMLISVLARRVSVAIGTAIFLWLVLVFVTDLGLMAGTMAFKISIQKLFALSLVNPLQVFKMWSLHAVGASLDVLGPAGLYATEEYGRALPIVFAGCLAAWVLAPLAAAAFVFSRRSPL